MSFEQRLDKCNNPLLRKLFNIIITKQTTLCVAADFRADFQKTIRLIEKIGKHICILKVHSEHFGLNNIEANLATLLAYKKKYNFLLFEDRKFYDSAETVLIAYTESWAKYFDLVTVIPICGDGIFKAIEDGAKDSNLPDDEPRGCLAVCEVSMSGFIPVDAEKLYEVAKRHSSICVGIIGQKLQVEDKFSMIKATPGINISAQTDGRNQQWRDPESAVNDGTDIIIVGRGITAAPETEWEDLAMKYKEAAYSAYLKALGDKKINKLNPHESAHLSLL